MKRGYNFAAGPSKLPSRVIKKAAREMMNYRGTGHSIMEATHFTPVIQNLLCEVEARLRRLMDIPNDYHVLFVQGGGTLQFSMVPMNLRRKGRAAYIDTGVWSQKAIAEAEKVLSVDVVASGRDSRYSVIPDVREVSGDYDYVYMVMNNTAEGTAWRRPLPDTRGVPIVADASSCILSEEIDVSKFGIIFAGAQKNIGIAGVTAVIIRGDLVSGGADASVPGLLRYDSYVRMKSLYNTPPSFAIYMMGMVLEWLEDVGLGKIEALNREKAALLYGYLDKSGFYEPTIKDEDSRSIANITFVLKDPSLTEKFISDAAKAGIINIRAHKASLFGGLRVSIYNAMRVKGVRSLIRFMESFALRNSPRPGPSFLSRLRRLLRSV
ncbi:MAG: 3-phosphoserine/phosphohydroxythreonine transaminase [Rickettsiales bacterium]|jgi:phosphoserine aminotransferase|nr:3-phosphoserine/phosphohydroxythreonine transaminase [Rickettsiales bacterium]